MNVGTVKPRAVTSGRTISRKLGEWQSRKMRLGWSARDEQGVACNQLWR